MFARILSGIQGVFIHMAEDIQLKHDVIANHLVEGEVDETNFEVLAKRNRSMTTTVSTIQLVVGILTVWLLVGIFLIVLAATNINSIKKSNRIKHECVYYDTKRDMIFLQEWNDRLYIFKPSEIKAITFDSSTNVAMAMVYIDSKVVYVYLGLTTAEEIAKCKQRISEIQDR